MPPVADHLEHGKSSVVGNDRLAIDQARTNRQGVHRRCHIGEACGEVVAIAGDEPDTAGISPRDDAEAVVLDLMNPARSGGALAGDGRQGSTKPVRRLLGLCDNTMTVA